MKTKALIESQFNNRSDGPLIDSIKVNLYHAYELRAMKQAVNRITGMFTDFRGVDCIMVGDSYLTTHLGRRSTKLVDGFEQRWFFDLLCGLVSEVCRQLEELEPDKKTYIIADMPDGSIDDKQSAVSNAEALVERGADAVKIEIGKSEDLEILSELASRELVVVAHIGFTPQSAKNRTYGNNIEEAVNLFEQARCARDHGASAITVERVDQVINTRLCTSRNNALPVYSIFSGRSRFGGQSLNLWDSVFRPPFKTKLFPPTAKLPTTSYPGAYTGHIIEECFTELLRLTLERKWPLTPTSKLSPDEVEELNDINPWQEQN